MPHTLIGIAGIHCIVYVLYIYNISTYLGICDIKFRFVGSFYIYLQNIEAYLNHSNGNSKSNDIIICSQYV